MFKLFLAFILLQFLMASESAADSAKEKWSKQKLTYSFLQFPTKMSQKDALTAFKTAFKQWSKVVPKTLKKLPKNHTEADFTITFKTIDGPSGKNRRAGETGKIEIDDDENWKVYKIGEIVDPQTLDLTSAAMDCIRYIFEANNITTKKSVSFNEAYTDSNGNYVLPKLTKVN